MSSTRALLVEGAGRVGLPYGLFSQVAMRPTDERWQFGVQWERLPADPLDGIGDAANADPENEVEGLPKSLTKNWQDPGTASPFTVYGYFTGSPAGISVQDAQERAISHLQNREEHRVEQALWTGDLDNSPSLRSATANSDTSALPLEYGLGWLEEISAQEFGSQGVIHMTRGAALQALGDYVVVASGGRLTTQLGTPVIAGSGYDGSGPGEAGSAAAGTSWAYVTPPLFGYRSEVFTSSNRPGDLLDRGKNNLTAIAERTYLLGYDDFGVYGTLLSLATPAAA